MSTVLLSGLEVVTGLTQKCVSENAAPARLIKRPRHPLRDGTLTFRFADGTEIKE
ncbi:MAG: hypothetical protein MJ177_10345 [Clostridia bacterium]|nr:hypothetical protein [Clostridia bacterium]